MISEFDDRTPEKRRRDQKWERFVNKKKVTLTRLATKLASGGRLSGLESRRYQKLREFFDGK